MNFYDLHMHSAFSGGESKLEELASMAKRLGYKAICFSAYFEDWNQFEVLKAESGRVMKEAGISILIGVEARNLKELQLLAERRREFDILLARGGDIRMNRQACETPEVDILTHPEFERTDSGLDHTCMKLASKNKVAIEVNFREILISNRKIRGKVLQNIAQNIRIAKKYGAPIILCSGAISHYELRDPQIMISMACQLGMDIKEAKEAVSKVPEGIIAKSKERRNEKWVMPGVRMMK
jgi:ribonuclease P/MRP protein subunit RPP1